MFRQMPEELKTKALTMLETEDIDTVSTTLRIRKAALLKMVEEETVSTPPVPPHEETPSPPEVPTVAERKMPYYSPEFKAEALAMMEEKGLLPPSRNWAFLPIHSTIGKEKLKGRSTL